MPADFFGNPYLSLVKIKKGDKKAIEQWREKARIPGRTLADFSHNNVALICGTTFSADPNLTIAVLDFDAKHGGVELLNALEFEDSQAFSGPCVATPGGGFHYYFKSSARLPTRIGLIKGLDFIAENHYVLTPPSFIDKHGKSYVWLRDLPDNLMDLPDLPEWLAEKVISTGTRRVANPVESGIWTEKDVPDIRNKLANSDPAKWNGDYLSWLNIGFALHHGFNGLLEGLELWEEATRLHCPESDSADECEYKWARFEAGKSGGISYKSLPFLVGYTVPDFETIPSKPIAEVSPKTKEKSLSIAETIEFVKKRYKSVRYNQSTREIEIDGTPIDDANIYTRIKELNEIGHKQGIKELRAVKGRMVDLLWTAAVENTFNPISEYLDQCATSANIDPTCQPDQLPSVAELLCAMGYDDPNTTDEDAVFARWAISRWLVGTIFRYRTGYQNFCLVLRGRQESGKSSFANALGAGLGERYTRNGYIDPSDKDHRLARGKVLLWEIDEMGMGSSRKEQSQLKAFQTSKTVNDRPAFGHFDKDQKCITSFIGTTNDYAFLNDRSNDGDARRYYHVDFEPPESFAEWVNNDFDANRLWGECVAWANCHHAREVKPPSSIKEIRKEKNNATLEASLDYDSVIADWEFCEGNFVTSSEFRDWFNNCPGNSKMSYLACCKFARILGKEPSKTQKRVNGKKCVGYFGILRNGTVPVSQQNGKALSLAK